MFDPAKSLTWYMTTLGTQVPVEQVRYGVNICKCLGAHYYVFLIVCIVFIYLQVYALLDAFYNDLDRANVPHP